MEEIEILRLVMHPTITHAVQQAIPSALGMLAYHLYPLINPSSFEPPINATQRLY